MKNMHKWIKLVRWQANSERDMAGDDVKTDRTLPLLRSERKLSNDSHVLSQRKEDAVLLVTLCSISFAGYKKGNLRDGEKLYEDLFRLAKTR